MADVLLLQSLTFTKCKFGEMAVPQSCYNLDLPELGMVAGNGRFGVISSASAHLQLGRNVWVYLCQKRKAAITDRESLRHIQVHRHMKQTVSFQMKKTQIKTPKQLYLKEPGILQVLVSAMHSDQMPK